jgi:hypothetical protein
MHWRNLKSITTGHLRTVLAVLIAIPSTSYANTESGELSVLASTAKPKTYELTYALSSNGETIGSSRVQISHYTDGAYQLREYTHIHTQGWWGELDIRSASVEQHAADGRLVSADNKAYDGDHVVWTQANTKLNEVWLSKAEVEHLDQREEQALADIALIVLGHIAPEAGEALAISQSLLAEPRSKPEALRVSHSTFDTDFNNLPFFWAEQQYSLPAAIRLLDLDTLEIKQYQVSMPKNTQCGSSGGARKCQFYVLEAAGSWWTKKTPLKLWLAVNKHNVPHFIRVEGTDEDGPFQMKLTSGDQ